MIKLKDLLELKTMVYTDTVKPKHQKKLKQILQLKKKILKNKINFLET